MERKRGVESILPSPAIQSRPGGRQFSENCWAILLQIPKGKVTTYGAIAQALGTRSARAVGQALNRNPHAPLVPCHRVVAFDGKLCGYAGGLSKKARLLAREGVPVSAGRIENFQTYYFKPHAPSRSQFQKLARIVPASKAHKTR